MQTDFWGEVVPNYLAGIGGIAATVLALVSLFRSGEAKKTSETTARAEAETRAVVADTRAVVAETIQDLTSVPTDTVRRAALMRWVKRAAEEDRLAKAYLDFDLDANAEGERDSLF